MNCKELGYEVGDKFEIVAGYRRGQTVTLCYDDGTNKPSFDLTNSGKPLSGDDINTRWIELKNVKLLERKGNQS